LRAIAAAIGMVLLTGLSLLFLYEVRRTLVWLVVALLFTVALYWHGLSLTPQAISQHLGVLE
jgi:hypothetical protein